MNIPDLRSPHQKRISESMKVWWKRRKVREAPPSEPRATQIVVPTEAAGDLLEMIAAVIEWRDARQPCLDTAGASTTIEGRQARQAMWGRLSKAERALMAVARRCGARCGASAARREEAVEVPACRPARLGRRTA